MKSRILAWVDSHKVGAMATLRMGSNWPTAFKTEGATIPNGSMFGAILMARQKENSGSLYFSALITSYGSNALFHLRHSNGTWTVDKFTGATV